MSDDTTEALNRIAKALELQAHVNRLNRIEEVVDTMSGHEGEAYNATVRIARRLAHRIDQLTGYTEEDE